MAPYSRDREERRQPGQRPSCPGVWLLSQGGHCQKINAFADSSLLSLSRIVAFPDVLSCPWRPTSDCSERKTNLRRPLEVRDDPRGSRKPSTLMKREGARHNVPANGRAQRTWHERRSSQGMGLVGPWAITMKMAEKTPASNSQSTAYMIAWGQQKTVGSQY